eukprot:CAMPEP_0172617682 /NCGR_PEP_ID=MMETSP1068-20121228/71151_1 /TAXON_ID=35684 /ORGANISM="Pseudopedinella elastica, Strain CCMP716" /LENGTH=511 /DNA_ID=CAMNT_0013423503 /DNA_START=181 /DNA_END=1717 /DNA_ORIENTATION=-
MAKAQEDDNLCSVIKRRNLTATIVVGSDRGFAEKVKRCTEPGKPTPLDTVVKYANKWGYAVREYFDEDIPFIAHHSKNAMQGELRKIFGMADAMRPSGPRYGISRAQLEYPKPDLVMWVDGDAFIATKPISLEELVQRACVRAEHPPDYVRIIGNDSGNNVNAGWYIFGGGTFGIHMLKYLLELFEIYAPCKPWGQNIIQEALLVAMAGTPPPWDLSLPCAGQRFSAFPRDVLEGIEAKCAPEKDSMKDCVLSRAAAHMNATCNGRYSSMPGNLNGCFNEEKFNFAPNAKAKWIRGQAAIAATKDNCAKKNMTTCCPNFYNFPNPRCGGNGKGGYWGANGAGIMLLPVQDPETRFNVMRQQTDLLWHRGGKRLLPANCDKHEDKPGNGPTPAEAKTDKPAAKKEKEETAALDAKAGQPASKNRREETITPDTTAKKDQSVTEKDKGKTAAQASPVKPDKAAIQQESAETAASATKSKKARKAEEILEEILAKMNSSEIKKIPQLIQSRLSS